MSLSCILILICLPQAQGAGVQCGILPLRQVPCQRQLWQVRILFHRPTYSAYKLIFTQVCPHLEHSEWPAGSLLQGHWRHLWGAEAWDWICDVVTFFALQVCWNSRGDKVGASASDGTVFVLDLRKWKWFLLNVDCRKWKWNDHELSGWEEEYFHFRERTFSFWRRPVVMVGRRGSCRLVEKG